MDKDPWEKIPVNAGHDPWEKPALDRGAYFKDPNAVVAPPKILQKQPEDVSDLDRFKIANLGNDPKASMEYLRQKYPDYEVGMVGDQIGLKKKGDQGPFQALMPKVGLTDIWQAPGKIAHRATDFTSDLASGLASTLAGAGAATAALPTGPAGVVAAGAAGGAAGGAGFEGLRQGLGKYFGVNQEVKSEPVVNAGVAGGVGNLAFGAGPATGAIGAGYNLFAKKVAPKLGEIVSGVPAKTIATASERMPEIRNLEQNGVTDFSTQAHENISKGLQTAKQEIGQKIQQGIENAGGTIDLATAKEPFEELYSRLKAQYNDLKTPELRQKLKDVKETINNYFSKEPVHTMDEFGNPVIVPGEVFTMNPEQAFDLKKSMADLGELDKVKATGIKSSLAGMSPAQKDIAVAARQSKKALDDGIGAAVDAADGTTGGMSNLRGQYRELNNLQNYLEPQFSTPEKTFNTMRNVGSKNKQVLMETMSNVDKKYGTDMLDNAKLLDAYNYFGNPSFNPLSTKGSTSTGRAIPLAGAGLGAGYYLGNKMHAGPLMGAAGLAAGATLGSPAALRQYMNVGTAIRGAGNVLGPATPAIPQTVYNASNRNGNMAPQSPWTFLPNNLQPGAPRQ